MAMVITSLALGVSFAAGSSISASAAAKLSSTKVTVCAKDSHCAASKTTITLKGTKKSYTVKAANNSAIAKVAKKGKKVTITGKKAGTTVVSLKLKNGKTLKCKVKVTEHSYGAAVSQTIDGKTYDVYTCENCGKSYKVESTSVDNPTLPDNPSDNPSDTPSDVPGDTPGGDMPPGGMPGGDMPPGEGGGAGSAGQEFGTFDEVKNAAGIVVDKDTVTRNDAAGIDITEGEGSSITADGLVNVKIAMKTGIAASNGIAISKASETDKFVIENSEISVASGEENNTLGYEAAYGVGIGVETGELWVKNSTITADGSRATPIYMFSTSSPSATSLVVVDSTISTSGDVWMPSC
jgi:hypothetical protein